MNHSFLTEPGSANPEERVTDPRVTDPRANGPLCPEGLCPYCGGSGWEVVKDPGVKDPGVKDPGVRDPRGSAPSKSIDGISQVKRCRCYEERRRRRLYLEARIPKKFSNCRLDNFEVYEWVGSKKRLNHSLSQPHEWAKLLVKKYPAVSKGLFLMGTCGAGKTHLAAAIISELTYVKGVPCLFYDFRDLLKEIRASYDPNSPISEFSVLEPVVTKEVLALDDLGAWKITDWVRDIVNYIINKRYNENLITIITSNWMDNPQGMDEETLADRIGVRLRSRLHEMCQEFEIKAHDYREKKKRPGSLSK